jgi:XapX domain-containing protein
MDVSIALLALLTGLVTGAVFGFLHVPIPAPPEIPGILGIVGIYLGYKLVEYANVGVNLLDVLSF